MKGIFSKSNARRSSNQPLRCLIMVPNQTLRMCCQQSPSNMLILLSGIPTSCASSMILFFKSHRCLRAVLQPSVMIVPPLPSLTKVTSPREGIPANMSGLFGYILSATLLQLSRRSPHLLKVCSMQPERHSAVSSSAMMAVSTETVL